MGNAKPEGDGLLFQSSPDFTLSLQALVHPSRGVGFDRRGIKIPECCNKTSNAIDPTFRPLFSCPGIGIVLARTAGNVVRRALSRQNACRDCAAGEWALTPFKLPASALRYGWILLAATPAAPFCDLPVADQPGPTERRALCQRIPQRELAAAESRAGGWLAQLLVRHRRAVPPPPLDLGGTPLPHGGFWQES